MAEPHTCVHCGQSVGREWWDLHVKNGIPRPRSCESCLARSMQGAMRGEPRPVERFQTDGREVLCQPNA